MWVSSAVGLRPYSEQDATRFFGREKETDRLCSLVSRNKITFLVGASGIGKTSLIHAGLIPALRMRQPPLELHVARLSAHPMEYLCAQFDPHSSSSSPDETALVDFLAARLKSETLIILDQYEETIALASSEERRSFE